MNGILWDQEKERILLSERGINMGEVADLILNGTYHDIVENPVREGQLYFILEYRNYTHVVPFVIDRDNNIVLKTVFPSRKFHALYGGSDNVQT